MLQRLVNTCLLLLLAIAANAHTLPDVEGVPAQFAHELLGLHHWPLSLGILVISGLIVLRVRKTYRRYPHSLK